MTQDPSQPHSMTTDYRKALLDAQKELGQLLRKLKQLRKRKAHLETVIFGTKLALSNVDGARTLSDSIRLVLRATEQFIRRNELVEKVRPSHRDVNTRSICTVLSYMVRRGEALRGKTPSGRIGFKWNPFGPLTGQAGRPLGSVKTHPGKICDSIRLVLMTTQQFMSSKEVLEKVRSCHVNPRSERSLLYYMIKRGEVLRGKTPAGRIGYKWNPSAPQKPHRARQKKKK